MVPLLWACIKGPQLYHIYTTAGETILSTPYPLNPLEHGCQQVIKGVTIFRNIVLYISPIVLLYLWRNNYTIESACFTSIKLFAGFSMLHIAAVFLRGAGRTFNPTYNTFLKEIETCNMKQSKSNANYSILAQSYDCDFSALPVSYRVESKGTYVPAISFMSRYLTPSGLMSVILGRPLIYPGSIQLLLAALGPYLEEGRTNLMQKHSGKRSKVVATDANEIDTVFVDRRERFGPEGNTLVICCEGNAGFYEVGIMQTPLTAGYSVLGWNIPGFAYSTGQPYPDEIGTAADAVMQFAINSLGFTPDSILVYGWSIGGYPASRLAMNYPEIRGLILDATFDHLLPLALPRMPWFMGGLVTATVGTHFNLCVAVQTSQYHGPLTIVRRTDDEIIATVEGDLSTNRGNDLLEAVLEVRYPNLFKTSAARLTLKKFLAIKLAKNKEEILNKYDVNHDDCIAALMSHSNSDAGGRFPSTIGQDMSEQLHVKLLLFLASKLLVDVDGGHPTPLDGRYFKLPWTLVTDPSYVQATRATRQQNAPTSRL